MIIAAAIALAFIGCVAFVIWAATDDPTQRAAEKATGRAQVGCQGIRRDLGDIAESATNARELSDRLSYNWGKGTPKSFELAEPVIQGSRVSLSVVSYWKAPTEPVMSVGAPPDVWVRMCLRYDMTAAQSGVTVHDIACEQAAKLGLDASLSDKSVRTVPCEPGG